MMNPDPPEKSVSPPGSSSAAENRKTRLEQKKDVTSRLSETTRFIGFGVVAWVFSVHNSGSTFSNQLLASYGTWVGIAGALAMLAIVFDYLQYIGLYNAIEDALLREDRNFTFDKNHFGRLLQTFSFWAKQVCAGVASATIVVTFLLNVLLH